MQRRDDRRFAARMDLLEGKNSPSGGLANNLNNAADARREHAHSGQVQVHRVADDNLPRHSGQDEQPDHDAGDDNNRNRPGGR